MSVQAEAVEGNPRKLAGTIDVEVIDGKCSFRIDGEEFPFAISEEGVSVVVGGPMVPPAITITILARQVNVRQEL
jgi:hypothetical protein